MLMIRWAPLQKKALDGLARAGCEQDAEIPGAGQKPRHPDAEDRVRLVGRAAHTSRECAA